MDATLPALAAAGFTATDWLVLAGYFLVILASGVALSMRKQAGTEDYFLGGRSMPGWAVAVSLVATALSAATFVGGPQASYAGDLTYLFGTTVAMGAALVIVAWLFIPVFYRQRVTTVYDLLEQRMGRRAKFAASWMFMLGRVFASGARIFIASIPAALILFDEPRPGHMMVAIAVLTVVGVCYTLVGGIRSVIWTDVIQMVVFVGAAVSALVVLAMRVPAPPEAVLDALRQPGEGLPSKLVLVDPGVARVDGAWRLNFGSGYTLVTALTGLLLLHLAAFGTDHDLAQRLLTCKSAARGSRSAVGSLLVNVPVTALFMAVGLGLYIFYQRPDLMGAAAPGYEPVDSPKVFVTFILREMPAGLKGLLIAGLFAAGLSSLNSALSAMSATFVSDFWRHARPGQPERHYVLVGRLAMVGWGVVLGGFASFCVVWHGRSGGEQLVDFALRVMTFAYSGLLAVFLTALLTKRGSEASVIAALAVGFVVIVALEPGVWPEDSNARATLSGLAYPWRMLLGTALAFVVCCAGSTKRGGPTES